MTATPITAEDLIRRCADDIAYIAEETPAADLDAFIDQLDTAVTNLSLADIHGHEDIETARTHLIEASGSTDETTRNVFLRRADKLLKPVWDMKQEYRDMVGD